MGWKESAVLLWALGIIFYFHFLYLLKPSIMLFQQVLLFTIWKGLLGGFYLGQWSSQKISEEFLSGQVKYCKVSVACLVTRLASTFAKIPRVVKKFTWQNGLHPELNLKLMHATQKLDLWFATIRPISCSLYQGFPELWSLLSFARGCAHRGPGIWHQLQQCGWW